VILAWYVDKVVRKDGGIDPVVGGQVHVGPHLLTHAELKLAPSASERKISYSMVPLIRVAAYRC
jgi:hypothetical protein